MFRFFLARHYMFRRPVSYLAMVLIGVAVAALIVVWSIMNGFLEETRTIVRGTMADIVVLPLQRPDDGMLATRTDYERAIASKPGVSGVCSRLVRPAVLKVHGSSNLSWGDTAFAALHQVVTLGIDPEVEMRVTDLSRYLADLEDTSLAVEDPRQPFRLHRGLILDRSLVNANLPHVLVGETRMRALNLRKGQALDLVTLPDGESLGADTLRSTTETFVIAGAFRTGHHDFDMVSVFVTRDAFRGWTGTRQEVSEMYVSIEEPDRLDAMADEIVDALAAHALPAHVETWMERKRVYLGAVENERNILAVVLSLFVLLTSSIAFAVTWMTVQEKIRDIGILSAMGASASGVGSVFAACGLFVAVAGGTFGFVAGTLLAVNANAVKDWIESTFGIQIFNTEVYAFSEIPTLVNHGLNALIVLGTVAFTVLICVISAVHAARMDPVDALRHE